VNVSFCVPSDHLAYDPVAIAVRLSEGAQRVLLFGEPGVGKTTLAAQLAVNLSTQSRPVWCLGADPGSPVFGIPGAVCLALWHDSDWSLQHVAALCTLDAARFRLPLVLAVRRLVEAVSDGILLLDAPGVIRGVAGAELLNSLVYAANIDLAIVLSHPRSLPPLPNELNTLGIEVMYVKASDKAKRPGKKTRALSRTKLWNHYLGGAEEYLLPIRESYPTGTPPRNAPEAWLGKQVAFINSIRTIAMGEVIAADIESLRIRMPAANLQGSSLLVRDAGRDSDGMLSTGKAFADKLVRYIPPADLLPDAAMSGNGGARVLVQMGSAAAILVNGVFGDPLLHLRLRHRRRSLLFDLGEGSRLPARIAHQVSDVFITHAHVDHVSGFFWLLRSRIGEESVCRLYGPPGLSANIEGLIQGIHWDRIGNRGPRFEITELHGSRMRRFKLQAGKAGCETHGEEEVNEGVLLDEADFRVRAATLDHGTPVLAYAYEPVKQINIRKERLKQRKLQPGPWLNQLKQHLHTGAVSIRIPLPDGTEETVATLADELTLITPGSKLVYATDFADTPDNRCELTTIAQDAHMFFCEATFLERESEQAAHTRHLTTHSCAQIANEIGARHLIPIHFSRRYEDQVWRVYQEIATVCPRVVIPKQGFIHPPSK